MTTGWGSYPGKVLTVDEDGFHIGECYGPMSTETGGPLCGLAALASDERTQRFIRENFGEQVLAEALAAANELLAKKRR